MNKRINSGLSRLSIPTLCSIRFLPFRRAFENLLINSTVRSRELRGSFKIFINVSTVLDSIDGVGLSGNVWFKLPDEYFSPCTVCRETVKEHRCGQITIAEINESTEGRKCIKKLARINEIIRNMKNMNINTKN